MRVLYNINMMSHFSNIYGRYESLLSVDNIKYDKFVLSDYNYAYTSYYDNVLAIRRIIKGYEYIFIPKTLEAYRFLVKKTSIGNIDDYDDSIFDRNDIIKICVLAPSAAENIKKIIVNNELTDDILDYDYITVDVSNNTFSKIFVDISKKFDSNKLIYSKIVLAPKGGSKTIKLLFKLNNNNNVLKLCDDFDFVDNKELFNLISDKDKVLTTIDNVKYLFDVGYKNIDKSLKFPKLADNDAVVLRNKCYLKFNEKLNKGLVNSQDINRLNYELDEIEKCMMSGYFLIYNDIIEFCNRNGIVHSDRGSAASSFVNYILDITTFNPIKYNLMFDRFLSVNRIKPKVIDGKIFVEDIPDCDIDFQASRRDEVHKYLIDKYHTAKVGNYQTMKLKRAILEVCRALGYDFKSSLIYSKSVFDDSKEIPNYIPNDIKTHVTYLLDKIKSIGTHASGILIIPDENVDDVPVYINNNELNTLWVEGSGVNKVTAHGYIKFDILALKNLDILYRVSKRVGIDYRDIDYENFNSDIYDYFYKNTYKLKYVFQLESALAQKVYRMVKPSSFNDIVSILSLIRPGILASGIEKKFALAKNGGTVFIPSTLSDILESTYGCILFQEQYMQIFIKFGFDSQETNLIRKTISKSKDDIKDRIKFLRESYYDRFIDNGVKLLKNDFSDEKAAFEYCDLLWNEIMLLGQYCFNKAHAVSYAIVTAKEMYLRYNYEDIYMEEALSADDVEFSYKLAFMMSYFDNVVLPTIDGNFYRYKVKNNCVYVPLIELKYLTHNDEVFDIIRNNKFNNIDDIMKLLINNKINKLKIKSLVFSGALDNYIESHNGDIMAARKNIWSMYYNENDIDPYEEEKKSLSVSINKLFYNKTKKMLISNGIYVNMPRDIVRKYKDANKFIDNMICKVVNIYKKQGKKGEYYKVIVTDDIVSLDCYYYNNFCDFKVNNVIMCKIKNNGYRNTIQDIAVVSDKAAN